MAALGIPLLPWHRRERIDERTTTAARAPAGPVLVGSLHPGDKFETLHTHLIGKIVECCIEEEEDEDQQGMKVQLYISGSGWVERLLPLSCLVKQRE